MWSYPDSSKRVTNGRKNVIKMGDHERLFGLQIFVFFTSVRLVNFEVGFTAQGPLPLFLNHLIFFMPQVIAGQTIFSLKAMRHYFSFKCGIPVVFYE
jgi:hypothetical protein